MGSVYQESSVGVRRNVSRTEPASAIGVPTLLIVAEWDQAAPPFMAQEATDHFPWSWSTMVPPAVAPILRQTFVPPEVG